MDQEAFAQFLGDFMNLNVSQGGKGGSSQRDGQS